MIISPPSAIGTTTTTENSNSLQQHVWGNLFLQCKWTSRRHRSNIRPQNVIKSRPQNTPRIPVVLICSLGALGRLSPKWIWLYTIFWLSRCLQDNDPPVAGTD
jgi:hypothetical protein